MTVREDDDSYRPLDQRTLDALAEADTWRAGMHAMRMIEEANAKREEAVEKDWRNYIHDVAHEHHKQIAREIDNLVGAANVPKEDLRDAVEKRSGRWLGSRGRNPRTGTPNPAHAQVIEI